MKSYVYRGVAYDADQNATEKRLYSRPELFYRGVAHNGVRTIERSKPQSWYHELIYRGHHVA